MRIVEGGAVGIALWCILLAFQLLPGKSADTPGVWLFLLAGMAIGPTRFRPILIAALALAAATVVIVTETSIPETIAKRWVREDRFPDSGVAAIVVLSGDLNPNSTINAEALDHLITGLELVQDGKAPLFVTTEVQQVFPTGFVSSTTDQARIVSLFGGGVRWIHTRPGHSTRDEAQSSAALLLPRGIRSLAVVASPMHTRRACSAFEAVGFTVTCVPARMRSAGGGTPGPWPRDRLNVFGGWVYELAATVKYRTRGWLASPYRRKPRSARVDRLLTRSTGRSRAAQPRPRVRCGNEAWPGCRVLLRSRDNTWCDVAFESLCN